MTGNRVGQAMRAALALALIVAVAPARAETIEDAHGVLNPQSFSIEGALRRIEEGRSSNWDCLFGYEASKAGLHHQARRIFDFCASIGVPGAYPWMSWIEDQGTVYPSNPEMATEWDRRGAEQGHSTSLFNYGLDLLRGHGVARDDARGREMIDRAAAAGDRSARELIDSGYDLSVVTPDHEEWRYAKPMF